MQNRSKQVLIMSIIVPLLGLVMVIYWALYFFRGMPGTGIPWLSEFITAGLALCAGIGLLMRKRWAPPAVLVLSGMWAYGVIGGIQLVLENGLDFKSPFGALTDALLFPLILIFSIYLATLIWRERELFL